MTFLGTLRPYQEGPVDRMVERGRMLLAAEQGTGKTPITIAAIERLFDDDVITEPGLWITLGTLMYQTADAIRQFSNSVPLVVPAGTDSTYEQRCDIYRRSRRWDADYIILSYDAVKNDWLDVLTLPRGFMVVDEVSFIRGFQAQRSQATKKLAEEVPVRFGLTGTPIENGKPEEMFSIFEFVDPTLFGNWRLFERTFIKRNSNGVVTKYVNLPTFHKVMEPAIVRLRSDDPEVAPYMPNKRDGEPMLVPFDDATKRLYDQIVGDLIVDLDEAARWGQNFNIASAYGRGQNQSKRDLLKGRIGQKLQILLMLCDHPELVRLSAQRWYVAQAKGKQGGSAYAASLADAGWLHDLHEAPKLKRAVDWVKERLAEDPANKVVVFTRFVDMIDLIGQRLPDGSWRPYSGRMGAKKKDRNLSEFQDWPDVRVLISSDAGGFGLDIPQANYLLNYDLPDGAGAADQRDTRIVRTSSEFATVSRNWIFMQGSVEERNWARLNQKRAVAAAFVDGRGLNKTGGVDLTVSTLRQFLSS